MQKISIITVNLNNFKGLQKTIKSVVNQTYSNIEFIIIDGGSEDRSIDIIKHNQDKITYWISESDLGIYDAMNKGIKSATGDIICFLNAEDSYLNNNVIKYIVDKLQTEAEIAYSDLLTTNSDSGQSWHVSYKNITHKQHLFNSDGFAHCCTFYRRSAFKKVGVFNSSYKIVSDLEWNFRALLIHKLRYQYVKTISSNFIIGGISNNPKYHDIWKKENTDIRKKYFTRFEHFMFRQKFINNIFIKRVTGKLFGWQLNRIYKNIN